MHLIITVIFNNSFKILIVRLIIYNIYLIKVYKYNNIKNK